MPNNFDAKFDALMKMPFIQLPQRWNGDYFPGFIEELFRQYVENLKFILPENKDRIEGICAGLHKVLISYYEGKPNKAYNNFCDVIKTGRLDDVFSFFHKNSYYVYNNDSLNDPLKLYRVRNINEIRKYSRENIFHLPLQARTKSSSYRYSIPGFPCFYLGTSINVCLKEMGNYNSNNIIAAQFQLNRNWQDTGLKIEVVDLGIRPEDYVRTGNVENISATKSDYLYLYPLIAICSIVAQNKNDNLIPEYIVPQIMLQWVRNKYDRKNTLYGIRYFSCSFTNYGLEIDNEINNFSESLTSDHSKKYLTYVFPIDSQTAKLKSGYSEVLKKAFILTEPVYLRDFKDIQYCEKYLNSDECELKSL